MIDPYEPPDAQPSELWRLAPLLGVVAVVTGLGVPLCCGLCGIPAAPVVPISAIMAGVAVLGQAEGDFDKQRAGQWCLAGGVVGLLAIPIGFVGGMCVGCGTSFLQGAVEFAMTQ